MCKKVPQLSAAMINTTSKKPREERVYFIIQFHILSQGRDLEAESDGRVIKTDLFLMACSAHLLNRTTSLKALQWHPEVFSHSRATEPCMVRLSPKQDLSFHRWQLLSFTSRISALLGPPPAKKMEFAAHFLHEQWRFAQHQMQIISAPRGSCFLNTNVLCDQPNSVMTQTKWSEYICFLPPFLLNLSNCNHGWRWAKRPGVSSLLTYCPISSLGPQWHGWPSLNYLGLSLSGLSSIWVFAFNVVSESSNSP